MESQLLQIYVFRKRVDTIKVIKLIEGTVHLLLV